jgi:hypothetical protein
MFLKLTHISFNGKSLGKHVYLSADNISFYSLNFADNTAFTTAISRADHSHNMTTGLEKCSVLLFTKCLVQGWARTKVIVNENFCGAPQLLKAA